MSEELIPIVVEDGYVRAQLELKKVENSYVDFIVWQVNSWEQDLTPYEKEKYFSGSIKWDGCSHVWFGEDSPPDGYLHLCGKHFWELHNKIMEATYNEVIKHIKGYMKEVAE
jgi:hypothetical protein